MFRRIFQKIIYSPIPLLFFGAAILFLYLILYFFAWDLLRGEIGSLLDRFPLTLNFTTNLSYLLFLFFGLTLIWAVMKSKSAQIKKFYWAIAIAYFFLFSAILLFAPPLTSQDIFWNLFQGRIFTHYNENPYLVAPQNFPQDPFLKNIRVWQDFPMTHGPIWTFIVSIPSFLSPNNLFLQIIIIRIFLLVILGLLIIFLVSFMHKLDPRWSFPTFIALAWHPLLLIETINNAHNDILIGFAAVLGLYLIAKNQYFKGFIILWVGVLIKYVILLLIPLGLIFAFRKYGLKSIIKPAPKIIAGVILLTLIAYLPFGYNIFNFQGLKYQSRLFEYTVLPPAPFLFATLGASIGGINFYDIMPKNRQIPLLSLGSGRAGDYLVAITRFLSIIIFLIFYLWLLFKPFRDERDFFRRGFIIFFAYLLIAPFWFMAWYVVWLIPLAVAGGLGTTFISLGLSIIAFPYPFPTFQIIAISVGFMAMTIFLTKKIISIIDEKGPT